MPSKKPFVQIKECPKCSCEYLDKTICLDPQKMLSFKHLLEQAPMVFKCANILCNKIVTYYPRTGRITVKKWEVGMAGKYGVFLTEEEIEFLAGLLAKRKGKISYSIFLKLTEVAENIPVDERK